MDHANQSWVNLETGMSTGEYQFQFLINIDSVSQPSKHRYCFPTVFLRIPQWVSGFIPRNISDFLSTHTLQRNYTFDLIANSHIRNLIEQACSTLLEGHPWVATKLFYKCRQKTSDAPGIVHWCCLSAGRCDGQVHSGALGLLCWWGTSRKMWQLWRITFWPGLSTNVEKHGREVEKSLIPSGIFLVTGDQQSTSCAVNRQTGGHSSCPWYSSKLNWACMDKTIEEPRRQKWPISSLV